MSKPYLKEGMETDLGLEGEQGQAKEDANCDKPGKQSETMTRYWYNFRLTEPEGR